MKHLTPLLSLFSTVSFMDTKIMDLGRREWLSLLLDDFFAKVSFSEKLLTDWLQGPFLSTKLQEARKRKEPCGSSCPKLRNPELNKNLVKVEELNQVVCNHAAIHRGKFLWSNSLSAQLNVQIRVYLQRKRGKGRLQLHGEYRLLSCPILQCPLFEGTPRSRWVV